MLASEASQGNFEKIVFLTTQYEQIMKLEHLFCPKVGGGHKPTCAPPPLLKVGRHVPPCPPPPSPTPLYTCKPQYLTNFGR